MPLDEDSGTGTRAGNTAMAGGASGSPTGDGGAGATEPTPDGGSDSDGGAEASAGNSSAGGAGGNSAGVSGGGASSVGGTSGSGGSSGSGGVPPDMALCNQATYGGHDYVRCQELRTWADANSGCLAIGMRLVRVDDDAENQWLFFGANVPSGPDGEIWLGATDVDAEGEWRWTDGDLFWLGDSGGSAQNGLFSSWYTREPNDASIENCAVLDTKAAGAEWYDYDCEEVSKAYVCESF
jgi:hypothetical protein